MVVMKLTCQLQRHIKRSQQIKFELHFRFCLGLNGNITFTSTVRNINCKPFRFSIAFHVYLSVSDISKVKVEGIEIMDYLNSLSNKEWFTQQGDAITFEAEVNLNCW